jgi:hypothetical protein
MPWLVMGRVILVEFQAGGIRSGLGIWLAICVVTIPVTFLIMWIIQFFVG